MPVGGFTRMPFASTSLGAEQPLLNSELLGCGRDPLVPIKDAVPADGDCSATKVFAFDIQKSLRFRAGWPGNPARNSGPFRSQVPAFVIARPIVLPDNGDPGRRGFPRLATGRRKEPDIGVMAGALARRVPTGPDNVSKPEVRSRPGLAEPRDGEDVPGRAGQGRRPGHRDTPDRGVRRSGTGGPRRRPCRPRRRHRRRRPGTAHAADDRAAPCIRRGGERP